jgi:hypothetical protein
MTNNTIATATITEAEKTALINIVNSEFQSGGSPLHNRVWGFSVSKNQKEIEDALFSLHKKGLAEVEDVYGDIACTITKAGYKLYKTF